MRRTDLSVDEEIAEVEGRLSQRRTELRALLANEIELVMHAPQFDRRRRNDERGRRRERDRRRLAGTRALESDVVFRPQHRPDVAPRKMRGENVGTFGRVRPLAGR